MGTAFRNKGIASKIVLYLENKIKDEGFKTIRLETGTLQPQAIAFYKKYGYYEVERFGEYIDVNIVYVWRRK